MHFYEIHESDGELLLGVTLVHEERLSPPEFLALVEEARGRVIESYEEDSLVEAIALELGLSPATVRTYLRDAYQRLGVDNRVALIHRLAALDGGAAS